MSLISKDEYTESDRDIARSKRRRRNKVLHNKGGTNTRTDWLVRFLDGGSDTCRDVWENLEWKGLPTLDMGLVVLQTAQNLMKPFNLKIRNDYMKIEKICS